jgi:hypothetical protein
MKIKRVPTQCVNHVNYFATICACIVGIRRIPFDLHLPIAVAKCKTPTIDGYTSGMAHPRWRVCVNSMLLLLPIAFRSSLKVLTHIASHIRPYLFHEPRLFGPQVLQRLETGVGGAVIRCRHCKAMRAATLKQSNPSQPVKTADLHDGFAFSLSLPYRLD